MSRARPNQSDITGVILAGGRGRRMGGIDKGLAPFAGRPLIEWVVDALAPQVGSLIISANRNQETYAGYGVAVISDLDAGFNGPLAGMHSAMRAARTDWILTVPCDGPFLPNDLASRLIDAMMAADAHAAAATYGERIQPVYALLPVALERELSDDLAAGTHKVADWIIRQRPALADFSEQPNAFANINSPADAEKMAPDAAGTARSRR
jgi:molybdopterin-guanine dinucleotide biosynthesis protein A